MRIFAKLSLVTFGAVCVLGAASAMAAAPSCTTVVLNQEFIKSYPQAPAACQGVVTTQGVNKLHFIARVLDSSKDSVRLEFLNVRKDPVSNGKHMSFKPPAGMSVSVDGKKIKGADLKKGDVLDFWVPEKVLGFYADPESTELIQLALH